MKKKLILIAVVIGAIASLAVIHAMDNEDQLSRNDLAIGPNKHNQDVPPRDSQKESPAASQEGSSVRVKSQGIEGHVMDRQGNPVAGIEVIADNGGPSAGPLPKSWTDKEGHFLIKVRLAGTYEVYAVEKDDRICPTCPFYSGGITPPHVAIVSVLEGQTSNIVLEKPPKLPKITGRVFDAETNEAIVGSRITLRRADYPDYYLQMGPDEKGYFVILVPPAAVTVEVTSPGYEPWNYVRDDLKRVPMRVGSLKLNQGESRKLEVRLRRKAA
jgi:hypothetical protein